jgi:hypothetical protein
MACAANSNSLQHKLGSLLPHHQVLKSHRWRFHSVS